MPCPHVPRFIKQAFTAWLFTKPSRLDSTGPLHFTMTKVSRLSNRLAKALKRPSSEDKKQQMPAILVLDGLRGVIVRPVSKSNAVTRAKDISEKVPYHSAVDKISRPFNSFTKLLGRPFSENEGQQVSVKPKPHGRGSVGSGTASASHAVASSKKALETRQGLSTMRRTPRQLGCSSSKNGGKQSLVKWDKHGLGGKEVDTASASKATITVKSKPETSRGPLAVRRISLLANRVAKSLRRSFSKELKSPSPNNLAQHTLSGKSKPRKVTSAETPHPARNGPPRRWKRRVVRPPLLLTVPDNVLYLIRNQLSLRGANFLSLVCKRFYAVINPDRRGTDLGRYRASFLRRLEGDAPEKVVYRAFCNMLHNLPLFPELGCALGKVRGADAGARSWCYHIDWPLVRSVTNRHFFAHPKRKWPFEKAPFRLPPERHWTKAWPAWKTFRHARVINAELYVRNVHCLRSRPNQGVLRDLLY